MTSSHLISSSCEDCGGKLLLGLRWIVLGTCCIARGSPSVVIASCVVRCTVVSLSSFDNNGHSEVLHRPEPIILSSAIAHFSWRHQSSTSTRFRGVVSYDVCSMWSCVVCHSSPSSRYSLSGVVNFTGQLNNVQRHIVRLIV